MTGVSRGIQQYTKTIVENSMVYSNRRNNVAVMDAYKKLSTSNKKKLR